MYIMNPLTNTNWKINLNDLKKPSFCTRFITNVIFK